MSLLLYVTVVLIWGTTWIAIVMQQGVVDPTVSVFYRFVLAAGVLMVTLLLSGRLKPLRGRDHLWCLAQGASVFCLNFYCFYHAVSYISSGMEAVIFSMAVLFNALNSALFFRQPIKRGFWLAALLGLSGMLTLFWPELASANPEPGLFIGIGLSLLGTYCFSLGNMISARHQRHGLDLWTTNGWGMSYGALFTGLLVVGQGLPLTLDARPSYLGALLYLALFGSIVAFAAYFQLLKRIGASQAAYSTLLFPLVALSVSTLFEDYHWQLSSVLGMVLILVGNLAMFPHLLRWPLSRLTRPALDSATR